MPSKLERMIEAAIKYTVFRKEVNDPAFGSLDRAAIRKAGKAIAEERDGAMYCRLCDDGPFRPLGLLKHLKLKHGTEVEKIIQGAMKSVPLVGDSKERHKIAVSTRATSRT